MPYYHLHQEKGERRRVSSWEVEVIKRQYKREDTFVNLVSVIVTAYQLLTLSGSKPLSFANFSNASRLFGALPQYFPVLIN
jgi:hypothetical protein